MKNRTFWKWIIAIIFGCIAAYIGVVLLFGILTFTSVQRFSAQPEIPEAIALRQRTSILLTLGTPIHWMTIAGSSLPIIGHQLQEASHLYTAVLHLTTDLAPLDTTTAKTWRELATKPDEWKLIVSAVISDQELLTSLVALASASDASGSSSSVLPSWLLTSLTPFQAKNPADLERVASSLLGLNEPQTYLLVFQNENELRATGGFIGSYGELTIDDAQLLTLTASDTYTLDRASAVSFDAPWYFAETVAPRLYLRDANYNPHVPYTAKTLLSLYEAEGGTSHFNGVLFITPQILTDILRITGPIAIADTPYIFDADNAIETLQRAVEIDYIEQGIPEMDRKRVLRLLLEEISSRLFSGDRSLQRTIIPLASAWLTNKELQIYHSDPLIEQSLIDLGWAGEWIPSSLATHTDIVGFTDTNLGGLKSDRVIDRSVTGSITIDGSQRASHDLTLTTMHRGSTDPLIGHYQSFRQWSFAPGSERVSVVQERAIQPTIDSYQKLTQVGYFTRVRENESTTETVHVDAPNILSQEGTMYRLHLPKQAGMRRLTIDLVITTPFEIHAIMSSGIQVMQIGPSSVRVSGTLLQPGHLMLSSQP